MTFEEYIVPELLGLIPVLYAIGIVLKKYNGMNDKYIPLVLGIFSIVMVATYEFGVIGFTSDAIYTSIIQGVLCAAAAVYGNQLWRQASKKE